MKCLNKLVAPSVALALPLYVQAYQGEVEVGYTDGEIESVDVESYDVSGTYYFSQVDTSKGPLAEAHFLDRASGLSLGFSDGELEESGFEDVDSESQRITLHLVGDSGWTLGLGYTAAELEDSTDSVDVDVVSIGVGKYVAENGLLSLNFSNIEVEADGEDGEADTYSLDYHHVVLGEMSYSFDASLVYTDGDLDSSTGFILGATVYPSSTFGIGVNYGSDVLDLGILGLAGGVSLDDTDSDVIGLHARWFASESLSLALEYTDGEVEDVDFDALRLSVNLRF